ncbi:hypothetical protein D3C72_1522290 [compost metagenome]
MLLHEGAAALLDPHQPAQLQLAHGAADGVAVDREARGQFRLRGQLFAGQVQLLADVVRQRLANLAPYRHAGTPFHFSIRHLALPSCHQAFTIAMRLCLNRAAMAGCPSNAPPRHETFICLWSSSCVFKQ